MIRLPGNFGLVRCATLRLNDIGAKDVGKTARATIEIAHWILETSSVSVSIRDFEYVNLHDGSKYSTTSRKAKTIARTTFTAQIIQTLWPTV